MTGWAVYCSSVAKRQPTHRQTALLCGLVVLGFLWDVALGGGKAHAIGWLVALLLVAGISTLAARSRASLPAEERAALDRQNATVPQEENESPSVVIRPAEPEDLAGLIAIEASADKLFEVAGYGATPGPASVAELEQAAALFVAGRPAVGYVRLELVDGLAHIEGLSVQPKRMKQGIGTALIEAACDWAREQGYSAITLCTFADVPWNGPFYRKRGFDELTLLTPGLHRLRASEVDIGLDEMGPRIVMCRDLR
jgi:GNAT superfamily N-acetyltransferase